MEKSFDTKHSFYSCNLRWLGHDSGLRSFILFKVGSTSNTYDTNIGENKKGFESIVITKIYTRGLGLPIVKKQ